MGHLCRPLSRRSARGSSCWQPDETCPIIQHDHAHSDETTLVLTNRHKVFWPDEGYTKGNVLDYYREIAP